MIEPKEQIKVLDKQIELKDKEKEVVKEKGKWQVNIANAWGTAGIKIGISFSVGFVVGFSVAVVIFRITTVYLR